LRKYVTVCDLQDGFVLHTRIQKPEKKGKWCLIHHFTTVHKPEPFKSHISTSPPLGLKWHF